MAKKENNNSSTVPLESIGEISTIRNILMGSQINEFTQKFELLENRIASLEKELERRTAELEKADQKNMTALSKEITDQVQKLVKLLDQNIEKVEQGMVEMEERNRTDLGKTLLMLSKKLLE